MNNDCEALVDGIRACFPAITRNRVAINPIPLTRDGLIVALRAHVIVDEKFPSFDTDKLMTLLDADEMVAKDGHSAIRGMFQGTPCEILLVRQHVPT